MCIGRIQLLCIQGELYWIYLEILGDASRAFSGKLQLGKLILNLYPKFRCILGYTEKGEATSLTNH